MPALFYIESLRQRGNARSFSTELPAALENYLRAIVVLFYFSSNLDDFAYQLANVPHALHVMREDDDRKWAEPEIFTKVQIMNSSISNLHTNNFPSHTLGFAQMVARLIEWKASSENEATRKHQYPLRCYTGKGAFAQQFHDETTARLQ